MARMKIHLISQNVQGLNAPAALQRLRNYFSPCMKQVDIICLQEHKLRWSKLTDLGSKLWRHAFFFGCEASVGYGHAENEEGADQGRICLLVNPKIKHLIHSQEIVGGNQAQWIRFLGNQEGDIAVLNVYASNTSQERIRLWQVLRRELPGDCKWIACGDWNVFEDSRDKSTRCGRILASMELLEFNLLKM
jgi:exonuclease III